MVQKSCVPSESSLKTTAELGGRWEQKNMWGTLARGVFIYGTNMTGNITANNTTNTCDSVRPKKKKHNQMNVTQIILW